MSLPPNAPPPPKNNPWSAGSTSSESASHGSGSGGGGSGGSRSGGPWSPGGPWKPLSGGFGDPRGPKGTGNRKVGFLLLGLATALVFVGLLWSGVLNAVLPPKGEFRVISGSENKTLEPIVQAFCRDQRWQCAIDYKGSVDIMLLLQEPNFAWDAVWPAHSRWIELGDSQRRVKHVKSIMQSPVVFGVRPSDAQALGMTDGITWSEIVDLVADGRFEFLMTSATQSNSGFSAYIAMLTALSGKAGETLALADLNDPTALERVKLLLSGVQRSSGSSGWLKELFLEGAGTGLYRAMINYEAVLIEANQALERQALEPLHLIYPRDGVAFADSPLGFVARSDESISAGKEAFFEALQAHLLTPEVQAELAERGRRTGLAGQVQAPDPQVFKASWGIDLDAVLPAIRFPAAPVIEAALMRYQEALRKPSLTAMCLDFSGSMRGEGEQQMKRALARLFDPETARRFMLQPTPDDIFHVYPFNDRVLRHWSVRGEAGLQDLGREIHRLSPGGGTDIYACTAQALNTLISLPEAQTHNAAVVLLTDGRSKGEKDRFYRDYRSQAADIPIYSITFGEADDSQLNELADLSRARVFDGRHNLAEAFRKARGYN